MPAAPLPPDEQERLAVLRDLALLDTLPSQTFDDLTMLASQICGTPVSAVSLIDERRQWFKSRLGFDVPQLPRDVSLCSHTILEPDGVLVVEDTASDPRFADNPLVGGPLPFRFYAGAPLRADGHAVGTLCVIDVAPRQLTDGQLEALQALGRQVEAHLALRLAARELTNQQRDLQELKRQLEQDVAQATTDAVTDPLTGLLNRRGLASRLEQELQRCTRDGAPLSLLAIDLDGFKTLNDEQGHPAGDAALRGVSGCIRRTQRRSDVAGRQGGDEFLVLLPGTGAAAAQAAGERLRAAIGDAPWPITASIGVATTVAGRDGADALLEAGDRALYLAKADGRDRVAGPVSATPVETERRMRVV